MPDQSTGRGESGESHCPICLSTIQNITLALDCQHKFCYACINEWVTNHSRCPLCRQTIHHIRHKTRNEAGVEVDHDELVTPSNSCEPQVLSMGPMTMVITPEESVIIVVQPVRFAFQLTRYSMQVLDQGTAYFLRNMPRGTLFVLPSDLSRLLQTLESHGVTAYEFGSHNQFFSFLQPFHPTPFSLHPAHGNARQLEQVPHN